MKHTRILIASLAILGFGLSFAAAASCCPFEKGGQKDKDAKETSSLVTTNCGCPGGEKSGKDEA